MVLPRFYERKANLLFILPMKNPFFLFKLQYFSINVLWIEMIYVWVCLSYRHSLAMWQQTSFPSQNKAKPKNLFFLLNDRNRKRLSSKPFPIFSIILTIQWIFIHCKAMANLCLWPFALLILIYALVRLSRMILLKK